jgi:lysophospholipase L1-like esterase
MKKIGMIFLLVIIVISVNAQDKSLPDFDQYAYLNPIKAELLKKWPDNRTINLVFHGHSVPSGYFKTPVVNTLEAYPYQVLKKLKEIYPYAVINVITTSIGGENSIGGAERFEQDVLIHKPDVVFIDYALNDRGSGLEAAKIAWKKMIEKALLLHIKVVLLTPSPDLSEDILQQEAPLNKHTSQILQLGNDYSIPVVNSYALFKNVALNGEAVSNFMAQGNHPNALGHALIADEIVKLFQK